MAHLFIASPLVSGDDGEEDAGVGHGKRDSRGVPRLRQGADRLHRRLGDETHPVQPAREAQRGTRSGSTVANNLEFCKITNFEGSERSFRKYWDTFFRRR